MRRMVLILSMVVLSGCAWMGFGDDSETVATAEPVATSEPAAVEEAPVAEVQAPAKSTAKSTSKTAKKGSKSEAQIKAELDAMGRKLASQAARTIVPNKTRPEYRQVGGEWIATYVDVDPTRVTTEMKPGSTVPFVGVIYYQERHMECRGKTKQAALTGDCRQTRTRNLKEMISYDGKQWRD